MTQQDVPIDGPGYGTNARDNGASYHARNHRENGRDRITQRLLNTGTIDGKADDPVLGDIILAQTVSGETRWARFGWTAPGANNLRVLGGLNGEGSPSYKDVFDATNPSTVVVGGAAAPGTNVHAAHRDHVHDLDLTSFNEQAQDAVGAILADTSTIDFTYDDGAPSITADVKKALDTSYLSDFQKFALTSGQQLTSNSTAFQNIIGALFNLAANSIHHFHITLVYLSTAAADFKFQFTGPAGATMWVATSQFVNVAGASIEYSTLGLSTSVDAAGAGANVAIEISGTIVTGGTAGNLQLQAAQNTATVENTDFVVQGTNGYAFKLA